MIPSQLQQLSDPLATALNNLKSTRMQTYLAICFPIPMLVLGLWLINELDGQYIWYHDPLLALIMFFFSLGQIVALVQLIFIVRGTLRSTKVTQILKDCWNKGIEGTLAGLQKAPDCHLRDALFLWVQQVQLGDLESFESLQDRQHDRREQVAAKKVAFHIAMNRATLKLGFIGTLIGLLLTFAPMKDALVTLKKDDGELGFISDIARAIDGDQYAILATLIASALSVVVETVNMQWLERILARFELVNNHIEEWSLTVLLPWARSKNAKTDGQNEILEIQKTLDENLRMLKESAQRTQAELHHLVQVQGQTSQRIELLAKQEESYKSFLRTRAGMES